MLRNVDVTAYPTMGGMRGKQALIVPFMNPVLRGRTSNSSIALQIVGVSKRASAARRSADKAGICMESVFHYQLPGWENHSDYNEEPTVAASCQLGHFPAVFARGASNFML